MITRAQVEEAHRKAPEHRFALRDMLKVDESKATDADRFLIAGLRGARTPAEFDAQLHNIEVNRLFTRGVLYIGEKK